jgi:SAM-dependent methyltransferase
MSTLRSAARAVFRRFPRSIRRAAFRLAGRPFPDAVRQIQPSPTGADADDLDGSGAATFKRAYVGARPDLVERLPIDRRNVLDLGCATGQVGAAVKRRIPLARVTGVEIDPAMAAVAAGQLDRVVAADLESADAVLSELAGEPFDAVIAGDILEHLVDPWRTLRILTAVLAPDAVVVASLPNVGFWDTWWNVLVRKRWPYRPRGIHDSTHLRFFARRNLEPLFAQAGYRVERIDRSYRLIEQPHPRNRFARYVAIPGLRDLLTFQYLVIARRDAGHAVDVDRPRGDHGELIPPA